MSFTLNNIPEALAIQSGIEKTQNSLQDTLYRLATGVNLNKSAVVDSVNSYDVPIHSEAIRNVSDAISLNSTAIDAVDALISISNQLAELAGQNRISVDDARTTEFNALVEQYNAIVTGTSYVNNQELLETERDFDIQVAESQAEITIGEHLEGSAIITIPGSSGGGGVPTVGIGSFTLAQATSAQTTTFVQDLINDPLLADFDNDGNLDLLLGNTSSPFAYYMQGNGDGTFQSAVSIGVGGGITPDAIGVGDFDNDGNQDFAVSSAGQLVVLLGNGDGTFQAATSVVYSAAVDAKYMHIADFDGDGNEDIAVGGPGGADIFLGDGAGSFAVSQTGVGFSNIDMFGNALASGDFDGDGNVDLLAASNPGGPMIAYGNGDGTFGTPVTFAVYSTADAQSVLAVDIDNDGNLDIVWGSGGTTEISVLLGNGNGTFQSEITSAASGALFYLAAVDNNNDGDLDILKAPTGGIQLYYGNGDGTFSASLTSGGGNPTERFITGDINGDGVDDVVAVGGGSNAIWSYTADTTYVAPASATPDTTQTVNVARLITGLSIDTTSNANTAYEEISGRIIVLTREQRALQSNQTVLESAMGQVKGIRDVLKDSLDLLTSYDQADNLAQLSALQLKQLSGQAARNTHRLSFQTVSQLINSNTNIFSF